MLSRSDIQGKWVRQQADDFGSLTLSRLLLAILLAKVCRSADFPVHA